MSRLQVAVAFFHCAICATWAEPTHPIPVVTNSVLVEIKGGIIVFRGFDPPSTTTNYPDDRYEDTGKIHRFNASLSERIRTESAKAFRELRPLVKRADTSVLLQSFRTDHPVGNVDESVAGGGNLIIGQELARRRPLPASLVDRVKASEVYVGANGPNIMTLKQLLDYYAELPSNEPSDGIGTNAPNHQQ